jgi:3-phenylpropionate/trans-cinnamate dioxygenase ferredoxin subunit
MSPERERILLGKADLEEGGLRGYELGPERFVLVSRLAGRYYAIDDWCNHAGCLLSGGRREGRIVICPCHEIGFDLITGKNVTDPKLCDDQPRYRVVEEGGSLYLLLGE